MRPVDFQRIDDPEDFKPETWVDIAEIDDPDATKVSATCRHDLHLQLHDGTEADADSQPADWDEDAPLMVTDTSATKPDDWLEDEPEMIPDPEAEKPEQWDVSIARSCNIVR